MNSSSTEKYFIVLAEVEFVLGISPGFKPTTLSIPDIMFPIAWDHNEVYYQVTATDCNAAALFVGKHAFKPDQVKTVHIVGVYEEVDYSTFQFSPEGEYDLEMHVERVMATIAESRRGR